MKQLIREDIEVSQLSNGQVLEIKIFDLKGSKPGPHVHIQASVHGAEVQGNPVIWELMKFLSQEKVELSGSLTFIPLVNPIGSNTKSGTYTQGRFNAVTGDNWNRNFVDIVNYDREVSGFDIKKFWEENKGLDHKSQIQNFKAMQISGFERITNDLKTYGISDNREFNLVLQKLAAQADLVLDLHTGPAATRYLYVGEYALNKIKDIPFPHNLIIPNEYGGAMDEATFFPWTELAHYIHEQGESFVNPFESYTVELGSEEIISFEKAKEDALRLLILLSKRGLISEEQVKQYNPSIYKSILQEKRYACLLKDYRTYNLEAGGLVEYLKSPGERIAKDEPLYRILDFSPLHSLRDLDHCTKVVKAKNDAIIINHTPSACLTKGKTVYQVMEDYYEL